MESPIWLPPLTAHNQYVISVKASQPGQAERDDQKLEFPHFAILIKLSVIFFSDNVSTNERCIEGLNMEKYFSIPCHEVTAVSGRETISSMLYDMKIPFEFDGAIWREKLLNEATRDDKLTDNSDFLERIWLFLLCMKEQAHNSGKKKLPFKLEIEKMVTIPDHELKEWNAYYKDKRSNDPNFEREFQEAIRRPRTDEELIYETTLLSRGATKSSIQALEVVTLDDGLSSRSYCCICLDESKVGIQENRLPCSHIFHRDCISRWLLTSNMCPLCRYRRTAIFAYGFACWMREKLSSINPASYNILPFTLEIRKEVKVPHSKLKEWNSWYDDKKKNDPNFEKDYKEAISRPRTIEELTYERSTRFRATSPSCIRKLEVVRLEGCSSNKSCPICLEDLVLGSEVTRLHCYHVFHGDCIRKWLQESHMCPLCRSEYLCVESRFISRYDCKVCL